MTATGKRTRARVLAMQVLYQLELHTGDAHALVGEWVLASEELDGEVRNLARRWALEAWAEHHRIDRLISDASAKWELHRIAPVDRAILRLSVYELLHESDTPAKVAMNEAIELAKNYSTKEAGQFVNGVLDGILNRPDLEEFKQRRELPPELA